MPSSWEELDPVSFRQVGSVTDAYCKWAQETFALQVSSSMACPMDGIRSLMIRIVLSEGRGTCSTKHALLRRLAIEQSLDLTLVLGIYEMSERNTPGVGAVLLKHGLCSLPEAHCYVRAGGKRIDVTRAVKLPASEAISRFLFEQDIEPQQITDYKTALHKQFLSSWVIRRDGFSGRSLENIWAIREECIASLST